MNRLKSPTHLLEDVAHLHGDFSTPEPVKCSCRSTFLPRFKHIMRDGSFEDTILAVGFPVFRDRRDAGRALGVKLGSYAHRRDAVVLGIPRGGVPVAFEVAAALDAPLDVFLVRKLGAPRQEELAMGAIASGGVRTLNPSVIESMRISPEEIERVAKREEKELRRRELSYREKRPPLDLDGRIAILVDDGLATGSSMRAAVGAVRKLRPARIVVAVPVAPPTTAREMRWIVDDLVCVATPEPFYSVGRFYESFDQTTDAEVRELLRRSAAAPVEEAQKR